VAEQEAAEIFVTEMFHKSDMARKHAKRHTLHVEDIRFSRFMTQVHTGILFDNCK
jgi:histone H3/H4